MKRSKFIKHLEESGCVFVREGGSHTLYRNPLNGKFSTVPRHPDIKENLCLKICKDLDIKAIV